MRGEGTATGGEMTGQPQEGCYPQLWQYVSGLRKKDREEMNIKKPEQMSLLA